jgi:O-antigen ligase
MDQQRMQTVPSRTLSSEESRSSTRGGRPLVFALIVVLALSCLLAVLLGGPAMPLGSSITMAGIAVALVALGWLVAGPRGR